MQPVDKSGKGQAAGRRRRAADSHHLFCRALANLHSGFSGLRFSERDGRLSVRGFTDASRRVPDSGTHTKRLGKALTEVIKSMGVAAPRCEKAVTNDTLLCVEGKSREVGGVV